VGLPVILVRVGWGKAWVALDEGLMVSYINYGLLQYETDGEWLMVTLGFPGYDRFPGSQGINSWCRHRRHCR
jgi:hypothetical protein